VDQSILDRIDFPWGLVAFLVDEFRQRLRYVLRYPISILDHILSRFA